MINGNDTTSVYDFCNEGPNIVVKNNCEWNVKHLGVKSRLTVWVEVSTKNTPPVNFDLTYHYDGSSLVYMQQTKSRVREYFRTICGFGWSYDQLQ
jgi:hypothetical protein